VSALPYPWVTLEPSDCYALAAAIYDGASFTEALNSVHELSETPSQAVT